jgi:hypothetical protein
MKRTAIKLSGLALAMAALAFTGCSSGGGSTVDNTPVIQPAARATLAVALQTVVLDAATGLPITVTGTDQISVSVYGTDANKVVDGNGATLYSPANGFAGPLTTQNGILTVYLKPGTPVPDQMSLRLVASAKNYLVSSNNLVIKSTDLTTDGSTTSIQVPITLISASIDPNLLPATVKAATTPVTLTGGVTPTAPTTAVTVADPTINLGTAKVTIPATTTIYADAAKKVPLPAGTTAVSITYNNNSSDASLAAFPGGFTTNQGSDGSALPTPGTFISGGFASVEVTSTAADGTVTKAKTFDKPISITVSIPNTTTNPYTGAAVATGDVIPIWSYDTTTGDWSVMTLKSDPTTIISGTVGNLGTDGSFPVTFQTDHLSYFNLDWLCYRDNIPRTKTVPSCDSAPFTITGAKGNALLLVASLDGGGYLHSMTLDAGSIASITSILNAPKGQAMTIKAYLGTNTADPAKLVGSVKSPDVCKGVTLNVTVPTSNPITYANVDVSARELCAQNQTVGRVVPSDGVTATATGLPFVTAMTGTTGVGTLNSLIVGKTYNISVVNRDGNSQSHSYTVLPANNAAQVFTFPIQCSPVTGATGGTSQGNF